jgi:tetraacyldisaccharide 4'-kinase
MRRIVLQPFSWIYSLVLSIRHWLYDVGLKGVRHFEKPVIVVGNLSLGGSGKTPHTIYLAELLRHFNPTILSRGYGRKTKGFRWVASNDTHAISGDEPILMKRVLQDIPVTVCESRVDGIERIIEEKNPGVILLDDAYQHRKLKAGFSILLIEYSSFSKPRVLVPAGKERDLWKRRNNANVVIITKCPEDIANENKLRIESSLKLLNNIPVFFSSLCYGTTRNFIGEEISEVQLKQMHLILVTGIADPDLLVKELSQKSTLAHTFQFADHYQFNKSDIEMIKQNSIKFANDRRPLFITTSKDRVRIEPLLLEEEKSVWIEIPVTIEIDEADKFNEIIENYVRSN